MLSEIVQKIFAFCQGRHTFFALFFTFAGTALAAFHRLDMPYVALITAVQGFVFVHSAKEDYFDHRDEHRDGDQGGDSK